MAESFFPEEDSQQPSGGLPLLDEKPVSLEPVPETTDFGSEEGRMAVIMAYVPFLCFVPLLSMKDNKEVRFHARQGVMLFLIELVAVLFLIDTISSLVFKVILLAAAGLSIAAIVSAIQGKSLRLPLIGDIAEKSRF